MTQYTQPSYPSTNTSTGIRFLYSNSVSAVPATTSKTDLQSHVPPEKKVDVLEDGIIKLSESTPVRSLAA